MSNASPANKRVSRLRERRRQAGLKRVEVVVPEEHIDAIKAYAAQLRDGSKSERLVELRKLVAKAYRKHFASCLDNISIDPKQADFADAAVVAAALMNRGNSEAFRLGREINRLAK